MKTFGIAATALLVLASGAAAQNAYWTGDTAGAPTMHRPTSLTTLAGTFANAVPYFVQPFYVSASGEYTAEMNTAAPWGDFDGYLLIYANSFDPTNTLNNLIAGDDDYSGPFSVLAGSSATGTRASRIILGDSSNFGGSGTGLNLTANVQYYAINTSYSNTSGSGPFEAAVGNGPGSVTLGIVPAPGAMALLAFGGLAAARRRR